MNTANTFPMRDLVRAVAEGTGQKQTNVRMVLDYALVEIRHAVQRGEQVRLAGFGTFYKKDSAARMGRNPQTGGSMRIPAKSKLGFRPGKDAKDL